MQSGRLSRLLSLHADLLRRVCRLAWPLWDLIVRFGLAQQFFIAGLMKLGSGKPALLTYHGGIRLITGDDEVHAPREPAHHV